MMASFDNSCSLSNLAYFIGLHLSSNQIRYFFLSQHVLIQAVFVCQGFKYRCKNQYNIYCLN